jgi:hypothetical protein
MSPGRGEGRSAQLISTKTYLVKNGQATLDQTQRRRSGSESRPKHSAGSRNQTESPCAKWVMSVPCKSLALVNRGTKLTFAQYLICHRTQQEVGALSYSGKS